MHKQHFKCTVTHALKAQLQAVVAIEQENCKKLASFVIQLRQSGLVPSMHSELFLANYTIDLSNV